MARLLIPGDGGLREPASLELSTAGLFSMQARQVLGRMDGQQLGEGLQAQGMLCGTMTPTSSGRAFM
jgi:hypothetical protein